MLVLAVPILDTTLVTVVRLLEGRPVTRGGRDHTSHQLVYQGLSDKRAVVLLGVVSAALGSTSLGYKVLDDTRITLAGVLITFAFLLQFGELPRRRRPRAGRVGRRRRSSARSSCTSAGSSRCVVDFALIAASFTDRRTSSASRAGQIWDQRHIFNLTLPALLVARYVFFVRFGLYRGVWRYAGARDAASIFAAVVLSELRRVRVSSRRPSSLAPTSRAASSSSTR